MKRKSTSEKMQTGTYRSDRDRPRLQFESSAETIKPPAYLRKNKIALAEWKAVAPYLEAERVLKQPDVSLLASYCTLYARWREAALDVETNGQVINVTSQTRTGSTTKPITNPAVRNEVVYQAAMMKAAVKFGLNPLDRPRVESSPFEDDEEDTTEEDDYALFFPPPKQKESHT